MARNLYEISNPSDPVTFEADEDWVAALAVAILGSGRMGCTSSDGRQVLPIFLFGGGDTWLEDNYEGLLGKARSAEGRLAVAAALESTAVCSLSARSALRAAVGEDREALERWNEAKRSSMNNICGRARDLARWLRDRVAAEVNAEAPARG
jgi:hypothetical protein